MKKQKELKRLDNKNEWLKYFIEIKYCIDNFNLIERRNNTILEKKKRDF